MAVTNIDPHTVYRVTEVRQTCKLFLNNIEMSAIFPPLCKYAAGKCHLHKHYTEYLKCV